MSKLTRIRPTVWNFYQICASEFISCNLSRYKFKNFLTSILSFLELSVCLWLQAKVKIVRISQLPIENRHLIVTFCVHDVEVCNFCCLFCSCNDIYGYFILESKFANTPKLGGFCSCWPSTEMSRWFLKSHVYWKAILFYHWAHIYGSVNHVSTIDQLFS